MPHFVKLSIIGFLALTIGLACQLIGGEAWGRLNFGWLKPNLLGPATLGLISGIFSFDLLVLVGESHR